MADAEKCKNPPCTCKPEPEGKSIAALHAKAPATQSNSIAIAVTKSAREISNGSCGNPTVREGASSVG